MSVLMEFAIFPTDKGESVSPWVAKVIDMIRASGYSYKLASMGTTIETETLAEALKILEKASAILEVDANRIYATAKFDIRKSDGNRMMQKVEDIEKQIGEVQK
jgi:uncharacterized protein (TIGR00106 family)